ncbi:MAG: GDSL-type esterase/lipase family protein, partial [Propionibacteriaceae bacterium]|nr:GDSL-type esterase/lipase family protein [Propionibacteriaceae bacterium]
GGRTTVFDDPEKPWCNGSKYLPACIESHYPDIVLIMLGTNDLKFYFPPGVEKTGEGLAELVRIVRECSLNEPMIMLVAPALISPDEENFAQFLGVEFDYEAGELSRRLAPVIEATADSLDCYYFNAAGFLKVGPDGLHLTAESHRELGLRVGQTIRAWG